MLMDLLYVIARINSIRKIDFKILTAFTDTSLLNLAIISEQFSIKFDSKFRFYFYLMR